MAGDFCNKKCCSAALFVGCAMLFMHFFLTTAENVEIKFKIRKCFFEANGIIYKNCGFL